MSDLSTHQLLFTFLFYFDYENTFLFYFDYAKHDTFSYDKYLSERLLLDGFLRILICVNLHPLNTKAAFLGSISLCWANQHSWLGSSFLPFSEAQLLQKQFQERRQMHARFHSR